MFVTHGRVQKDSKFGDVVDLGEEVDLKDDFQEVVVNFFEAFILGSIGLKSIKALDLVTLKVWLSLAPNQKDNGSHPIYILSIYQKRKRRFDDKDQ